MKFPQNRSINVITVGRANLDLYPAVGERFETARQYDAFVGGSPANIAVGVANLGLKSAIISRVAEDPHGHFVSRYLRNKGVDVSQMQFDDTGAKTSLAFAERRVDSRLCMYRNDAADLFLDATLVDDALIASAQTMVMTGFAFAHEVSRGACLELLQRAKKHDVVLFFDLDYRPYNWQSAEVAERVTAEVARQCDIIVGTRSEFEVLGVKAHHSDADCAKMLFETGASMVIIKRDKDGSTCFLNDGSVIDNPAFIVSMVKPFGAGDTFAATLLSLMIKDYSIKQALQYAAAAASINISGTSCTEAMPKVAEIEEFIQNYKS